MKNRVGNFLYNADRAIASLLMGAPPQETIKLSGGAHCDWSGKARRLDTAMGLASSAGEGPGEMAEFDAADLGRGSHEEGD